MTQRFPKKFKSFRVGPLPADAINKALGTELEVADVWVSKACHAHIAIDHPQDYPIIKAHIIDIIREPNMVGQDPAHGRNFYLVKRIMDEQGKEFAMIALGLELSRFGTYNVRSAYRISQESVTTRRLRGSLKSLINK
jgi:hypothetical protein